MKSLLAALLLASALASPARADDAPTPEIKADPTWTVPVLHSAALLGGMRASESYLWPGAFRPSEMRLDSPQLRRAFTEAPLYRNDRVLLESDGDPWTINTIGHGLFGSEVYSRFRSCGHRPLAALAATAITSTLWEYGVESFHQRPSAIDLLWTPLVGGLLFGEARYRVKELLLRGNPGIFRRIGAIVVDPLGGLERLAGTGC